MPPTRGELAQGSAYYVQDYPGLHGHADKPRYVLVIHPNERIRDHAILVVPASTSTLSIYKVRLPSGEDSPACTTGLPKRCWAVCDEKRLIHRSMLTDWPGRAESLRSSSIGSLMSFASIWLASDRIDGSVVSQFECGTPLPERGMGEMGWKAHATFKLRQHRRTCSPEYRGTRRHHPSATTYTIHPRSGSPRLAGLNSPLPSHSFSSQPSQYTVTLRNPASTRTSRISGNVQTRQS